MWRYNKCYVIIIINLYIYINMEVRIWATNGAEAVFPLTPWVQLVYSGYLAIQGHGGVWRCGGGGGGGGR